jgi:hypothetical protein
MQLKILKMNDFKLVSTFNPILPIAPQINKKAPGIKAERNAHIQEEIK